MDILDDMRVSKLSAKVVFFFLFFFTKQNKAKQQNKTPAKQSTGCKTPKPLHMKTNSLNRLY